MPRQHAAAFAFFIAGLSTPAYAMSVPEALSFAAQLVEEGYRAAPALMLGIALLAAIPLIAILAGVQAWATAPPDRTRRYRSFPAGSSSLDGAAVDVPGHACLELIGGEAKRFAILRDMTRIGREEDNDIRISSGAVHRYHAAIHRQDFGDYYITDLSGIDGNGIVVNGKRCADAHLHDGDVIELGPGRLRFRAGYV